MSFHEIRFPINVSPGASGGPTARTDIKILRSGGETRRQIWSEQRREYNAGLSLTSLDKIYEAMEFFVLREGKLHGFRWRDWADFKVSNESLVRTGEVYQLTRAGRAISKPVEGTVTVYVDGVEATGYCDYTNGLVFAFQASPSSLVTAGFEFDVPVRFDVDEFTTSVETFEYGEAVSIKVIELKQVPGTLTSTGLASLTGYDYVWMAAQLDRTIDLHPTVPVNYDDLLHRYDFPVLNEKLRTIYSVLWPTII